MCVQSLENIERLLLEQHLMKGIKIVGQAAIVRITHSRYAFGKRFGNELGAGGAAHAMRRKGIEFGIVRRVKAAVGNQKNFLFPRSIGQPADVRQKLFRTGDVKLASRKHEVRLSVDLPKD